MNMAYLLSKRKKEIDNRITLVLTYPPALAKVYEILDTQTYTQISTFNCSFTFTTSTCFPQC